MTAPRALSIFISVSAFTVAAVGCSDVTRTSENAGPEWTVGDSPVDESEPTPVQEPTVGPVEVDNAEKRLPPNPPRHDYEVHEWGTFTSVQSSEGKYLDGLHHEEESLPGFVHQFRYAGVGSDAYSTYPGSKGIRVVSVPEPVNQKLETPVIYFHTERSRQVDVRVDFPDGYVTEWYPDATEWHPKPTKSCVTGGPVGECYTSEQRREAGLDELAGGQMTWQVQIDNQPADLISVSPDDIWAPSRKVPGAARVTAGHETEKFIFYRGIGRFKPDIRVTSETAGDDKNRFAVSNDSNEDVPAAFYLHVDEDGGTLREIGSLGPESTTEFEETVEVDSDSKDAFVDEAQFAVGEALVDTGLTGKEARAMVDTWEDSYFRRQGHRILYVVPRSWTDELLPIEVEPKPDRLVRTLVGRIDLLTPRKEAEMVERVKEAYSTSTPLLEVAREVGRFAEPRFRQACPELEGPAADWCTSQVETLQSHVMFEHRDP